MLHFWKPLFSEGTDMEHLQTKSQLMIRIWLGSECASAK